MQPVTPSISALALTANGQEKNVIVGHHMGRLDELMACFRNPQYAPRERMRKKENRKHPDNTQ